MSLYSRSQLTYSLSSTACVQLLYASAARFAARTMHLNVWHEHGRSNVGPVHLGRQQSARMLLCRTVGEGRNTQRSSVGKGSS